MIESTVAFSTHSCQANPANHSVETIRPFMANSGRDFRSWPTSRWIRFLTDRYARVSSVERSAGPIIRPRRALPDASRSFRIAPSTIIIGPNSFARRVVNSWSSAYTKYSCRGGATAFRTSTGATSPPYGANSASSRRPPVSGDEGHRGSLREIARRKENPANVFGACVMSLREDIANSISRRLDRFMRNTPLGVSAISCRSFRKACCSGALSSSRSNKWPPAPTLFAVVIASAKPPAEPRFLPGWTRCVSRRSAISRISACRSYRVPLSTTTR